MRTKPIALTALVMGLFLVANVVGNDKDSKGGDHKKLVGTWTLVSVESDGEKFAEEKFKGIKLMHGAHKDGVHPFHVMKGDDVLAKGTFDHDEKASPKAFDAKYTEGKDKGKTVLGIYELDGDTLKLCWAKPGDKRPTKFAAEAKSGATVRVFKRDKK